jgi:hypothetical protein
LKTPSCELSALGKPAAWEYVVRFVFGGLVTACTGLAAKRFGPAIGGLFLAFPAILPASLTLVRRHDGRAAARDDARGAQLGALGLAGFAAVVLLLGERWPAPLVLAAAAVAWAAIAVSAWLIAFGR